MIALREKANYYLLKIIQVSSNCPFYKMLIIVYKSGTGMHKYLFGIGNWYLNWNLVTLRSAGRICTLMLISVNIRRHIGVGCRSGGKAAGDPIYKPLQLSPVCLRMSTQIEV